MSLYVCNSRFTEILANGKVQLLLFSKYTLNISKETHGPVQFGKYFLAKIPQSTFYIFHNGREKRG